MFFLSVKLVPQRLKTAELGGCCDSNFHTQGAVNISVALQKLSITFLVVSCTGGPRERMIKGPGRVLFRLQSELQLLLFASHRIDATMDIIRATRIGGGHIFFPKTSPAAWVTISLMLL